MRRLLVLFGLTLLLGGAVMAYGAAEWAGCKYLTAGSGVTITCPDTVGRGGATIAGSGGATPGGSTGQLQYNDSGSFGGAGIYRLDPSPNGMFLIPAGTVVASEAETFYNANIGNPGIIMADDGSPQNVYLLGHASLPSEINFMMIRGSLASPTKITTNDLLGSVAFWMYSGVAASQYRGSKFYAVAETDGDAATPAALLHMDAIGATMLSIDLDGLAQTITLTSPTTTVSGLLNIASGGSTTISTGVGSVKMSTTNAATNTAWIPIQYAGNTYYVPGWTTNTP